MARELRYGMGKGKIYPHEKARSLLNPLRRLVQPPGRLAARLELKPEMHVLEIGPGPGYFSVEIAGRIPRGRLCLFDIQAEMLRMARARLAAKGVVNAGAVQGDALALPFRDGSFDVAVLVAVLGEVPQPERCLEEIRRVLRPNGLLSVTEVRGDPDRIRLSSLRAMAERDGYRLRNRPGRGWSYTANFARQGGQALGNSEGSDGEAAR